jgi:hypothetical protein
MMFGSVPPQYIDPGALGSRYPSTSKPALPDTFVAPNMQRPNIDLVEPVAAGGGAVVAVGLLVLGGYLLMKRS